MAQQWTPKRTPEEGESFSNTKTENLPQLYGSTVNAILTAPGAMFELETQLVDGRVQRVYKNLWPSLRDFWLWASKEHAKASYIVFEKQRYSFEQAFERSVRAASVFLNVYGVRKGMSRTCPTGHG